MHQCEPRVEQFIRRPQSRRKGPVAIRRQIICAVTPADIRIVHCADELPSVPQRSRPGSRRIGRPIGNLENRVAGLLRGERARFRDLRILITDAGRQFQGIQGTRANLEFPALARRGARICAVLEAAAQQNILLDVLPIDVKDGRVDGQSIVEPSGLRTQLVIPQ